MKIEEEAPIASMAGVDLVRGQLKGQGETRKLNSKKKLSFTSTIAQTDGDLLLTCQSLDPSTIKQESS